LDNACFVVAAAEQLPEELQGLFDLVCVNFPWGSLLRALLEPGPAILQALGRLARPAGGFEFVLSYQPQLDPNAFAGQPLPPLDEDYIAGTLAAAYENAGLHIESTRRLIQDEALAIPSTWGRRLLHARTRPVFRLTGEVR
jgi:16S rRNA (adenine(1408)-N(1))-methyltransferase